MFDIHHIAQLARLTLSPETEAELKPQLEQILGYVEALDSVDTGSVDGFGLSDADTAWRADEPREAGDPAKRVALAAKSRDTLFFVPKVIGDGDA